jgi:hypothetical protein
MKTCFRALRTLDWGEGSPSNRITTKHTAMMTQEWLRDKFLNVLEWDKLPKYRCAKLVASYLRRLKALITAKCASTRY